MKKKKETKKSHDNPSEANNKKKEYGKPCHKNSKCANAPIMFHCEGEVQANFASSYESRFVHQGQSLSIRKYLVVLSFESLIIQNLLSLVAGSLEIGGSATRVEVLGKDWLEERSEDNLSTSSLGKSHPEDENKLEGIVEWEPVDGVDSAFEDAQEGENDPVCQPLGIIGGA